MRNAWLAISLTALQAIAGDAALPTRAAREALIEFSRVCQEDGTLLWGKSLCGPMILVDSSTHAAVANGPDPDNAFRQENGVFLGTFPAEFTPSNTAIQWRGQSWSTVVLPLPLDPFRRLTLLAHESFHRIQPDLGLSGSDAPNAHLDTEAGRLWLRLELRALARALRSEEPAGRQSARDAMLFRLYRHSLFTGSAAIEAAMEKQEGLAEYTGVFVGLRATGENVSHEARIVEAAEDSDAFARSFGYATGPALGLLLDRYAPGWRTHAATAPLDSLLIAALHQTALQTDLAGEARKRAARYGYAAVAAAEREREERHRALLSQLTATFIDGPTLDFPAEPEMYRNFNPMALAPFPPHGTFYPAGTFTANWGKLIVERGGALVAPDNLSVRVTAPIDPEARPVRGDGWALDLAPGWTIRPSERQGSFVLVAPGKK